MSCLKPYPYHSVSTLGVQKHLRVKYFLGFSSSGLPIVGFAGKHLSSWGQVLCGSSPDGDPFLWISDVNLAAQTLVLGRSSPLGVKFNGGLSFGLPKKSRNANPRLKKNITNFIMQAVFRGKTHIGFLCGYHSCVILRIFIIIC